jgi:acetyl/propionyl-CoA carboxylase alpha subunit
LTFEIELGGRSRTVSVEPAGTGRYRVLIDGHPHLVEAARVGEFSLSVIVNNGRVSSKGTRSEPAVDDGPDAGELRISREVQIAPGAARGELLIGLEGRTIAVTVNGRRSRRGSAEGGSQAHGVQTVTAPMPGRVVRVLVRPGDEIATRQGVIVVEAMKMENELRSPKAGKVKEVMVSPGTSVEAGRVLVVIE